MLAGGDGLTAVRLGVSMVALQASIGALNDVVDRAADAGRKPGKPIPSGILSVGSARFVVVLAGLAGLVLAAPSGPWLVALALVSLGVGYGYDLWSKGTRWSWLPFAIGIPLLPVFAWFGAAGNLPSLFLVLVPTAVVAGAALAIANAVADVERDIDAGVASVATWLGADRAWAVSAFLFAGVVVVAIGSLWLARGSPSATGPAVVASLVMALGIALSRGSRSTPARRERAWEIEAVGVTLLAAAWLWGLGDLG